MKAKQEPGSILVSAFVSECKDSTDSHLWDNDETDQSEESSHDQGDPGSPSPSADHCQLLSMTCLCSADLTDGT